MTCGITETCK